MHARTALLVAHLTIVLSTVTALLLGCGGSTPEPASTPTAATQPAATPRAPATATPTGTPPAPTAPSPAAEVPAPADVRLLALTDDLIATIEAASPDCSDIAAAVERWLEREEADYVVVRDAVATGQWPGADPAAAAELSLAHGERLDGVFTTFALCDGNPDTAPVYERLRPLLAVDAAP